MSPDLEYGETFIKTMNSPRRFRYYCSMYPHMMGEIRVQQSDQPRRKKHEADKYPSKVQALKNVPEIKRQKKAGYAHLPIFVLAGLKDD